MTIRSHPREWGYTLIEMMVTVAIVGVVSAITLTSFRPYFQEQKLRLAAGELENQLTTGRTIATKNSGNCRIRLLSTTTASFVADPDLINDVCTGKLRELNLYLSASTDLTISGDTTYTFTKIGTLDGAIPPGSGATSFTTLLSSSATPWVWCVNVSWPTGLVRVGTKNSTNEKSCNYRRG